jgi:hypothetical protein
MSIDPSSILEGGGWLSDIFRKKKQPPEVEMSAVPPQPTPRDLYLTFIPYDVERGDDSAFIQHINVTDPSLADNVQYVNILYQTNATLEPLIHTLNSAVIINDFLTFLYNIPQRPPILTSAQRATYEDNSKTLAAEINTVDDISENITLVRNNIIRLLNVPIVQQRGAPIPSYDIIHELLQTQRTLDESSVTRLKKYILLLFLDALKTNQYKYIEILNEFHLLKSYIIRQVDLMLHPPAEPILPIQTVLSMYETLFADDYNPQDINLITYIYNALDILGIDIRNIERSENNTNDTLRKKLEKVVLKAYKELSRRLHPNKGGDPEEFKLMDKSKNFILFIVEKDFSIFNDLINNPVPVSAPAPPPLSVAAPIAAPTRSPINAAGTGINLSRPRPQRELLQIIGPNIGEEDNNATSVASNFSNEELNELGANIDEPTMQQEGDPLSVPGGPPMPQYENPFNNPALQVIPNELAYNDDEDSTRGQLVGERRQRPTRPPPLPPQLPERNPVPFTRRGSEENITAPTSATGFPQIQLPRTVFNASGMNFGRPSDQERRGPSILASPTRLPQIASSQVWTPFNNNNEEQLVVPTATAPPDVPGITSNNPFYSPTPFNGPALASTPTAAAPAPTAAAPPVAPGVANNPFASIPNPYRRDSTQTVPPGGTGIFNDPVAAAFSAAAATPKTPPVTLTGEQLEGLGQTPPVDPWNPLGIPTQSGVTSGTATTPIGSTVPPPPVPPPSSRLLTRVPGPAIPPPVPPSRITAFSGTTPAPAPDAIPSAWTQQGAPMRSSGTSDTANAVGPDNVDFNLNEDENENNLPPPISGAPSGPEMPRGVDPSRITGFSSTTPVPAPDAIPSAWTQQGAPMRSSGTSDTANAVGPDNVEFNLNEDENENNLPPPISGAPSGPEMPRGVDPSRITGFSSTTPVPAPSITAPPAPSITAPLAPNPATSLAWAQQGAPMRSSGTSGTANTPPNGQENEGEILTRPASGPVFDPSTSYFGREMPPPGYIRNPLLNPSSTTRNPVAPPLTGPVADPPSSENYSSRGSVEPSHQLGSNENTVPAQQKSPMFGQLTAVLDSMGTPPAGITQPPRAPGPQSPSANITDLVAVLSSIATPPSTTAPPPPPPPPGPPTSSAPPLKPANIADLVAVLSSIATPPSSTSPLAQPAAPRLVPSARFAIDNLVAALDSISTPKGQTTSTKKTLPGFRSFLNKLKTSKKPLPAPTLTAPQNATTTSPLQSQVGSPNTGENYLSPEESDLATLIGRYIELRSTGSAELAAEIDKLKAELKDIDGKPQSEQETEEVRARREELKARIEQYDRQLEVYKRDLAEIDAKGMAAILQKKRDTLQAELDLLAAGDYIDIFGDVYHSRVIHPVDTSYEYSVPTLGSINQFFANYRITLYRPEKIKKVMEIVSKYFSHTSPIFNTLTLDCPTEDLRVIMPLLKNRLATLETQIIRATFPGAPLTAPIITPNAHHFKEIYDKIKDFMSSIDRACPGKVPRTVTRAEAVELYLDHVFDKSLFAVTEAYLIEVFNKLFPLEAQAQTNLAATKTQLTASETLATKLKAEVEEMKTKTEEYKAMIKSLESPADLNSANKQAELETLQKSQQELIRDIIELDGQLRAAEAGKTRSNAKSVQALQAAKTAQDNVIGALDQQIRDLTEAGEAQNTEMAQLREMLSREQVQVALLEAALATAQEQAQADGPKP